MSPVMSEVNKNKGFLCLLLIVMITTFSCKFFDVLVFMRQPVYIFPLRVSAASVSTILYHRRVRRETRTKRRARNGRGIHLDLLLPFRRL